MVAGGGAVVEDNVVEVVEHDEVVVVQAELRRHQAEVHHTLHAVAGVHHILLQILVAVAAALHSLAVVDIVELGNLHLVRNSGMPFCSLR